VTDREQADAAARAWLAATLVLVACTPGARAEQGRHGTWALFAGRLFQGVVSLAAEPDAGEIARLAGPMAAAGWPWMVLVRSAPGPELLAVAGSRGLRPCPGASMMARALDGPAPPPGPAAAAVRAASHADQATYAAVLAAAFGVPPPEAGVFASAAILGAPECTGYLAAAADETVAVGLAIRTGADVGIYNVGTAPGHRRRGYGRAVTEHALREAAAAGATRAYLQPSDDSRRLYENLGFRTLETWTAFVPGRP
jgi:ribosomal protein S18 acetylase RimI-like enzyme